MESGRAVGAWDSRVSTIEKEKCLRIGKSSGHLGSADDFNHRLQNSRKGGVFSGIREGQWASGGSAGEFFQ